MTSTFQELINGEKPVLIDFFAEWCGPCKMMTPILSELATQVGDKVTIVKIDVDKNVKLATQEGVMGVPMLMLYQKGKKVWSQAGVATAYQLKSVIENHLK